MGFGIVDKEDTWARMFQEMPELEWKGTIMLLYPLDRHDEEPEFVGDHPEGFRR